MVYGVHWKHVIACSSQAAQTICTYSTIGSAILMKGPTQNIIMPARYDNESFNKLVKNKYGDLFLFLEPYKNSRTKIKTECKFGHKFLGDPKKFTKTNGYSGCPICHIGETEEQYNINPKYCIECGNKIIYFRSAIQTRKKIFCSHSCSAKHSNKNRVTRKEDRFCIVCNNILKESSVKYCSRKCQLINQRENYLKKWKDGTVDGSKGRYYISSHIRNYLIEKFNYMCSMCKWSEINKYTGKIPLEIDHIDGDYKNNSEENLRVLCPNCHSLTPTYKGANMGNGRHNRSDYYIGKKKILYKISEVELKTL